MSTSDIIILVIGLISWLGVGYFNIYKNETDQVPKKSYILVWVLLVFTFIYQFFV